MRFDLDALEFDQNKGLEELEFEPMSVVTKNGDRLLCYYHQLDDDRAVIGFPFKVNITPQGVLERILKFDLLSDDVFFLIPTEPLMSVAPMSDRWYDRFVELVDSVMRVAEDDEELQEDGEVESGTPSGKTFH